MILRTCLDCGAVATRPKKGRCERCYRPNYGADHQRLRAELALTLPTDCAYGCGKWLTTDSDWVAAHVVDGDPRSPRVASCRSCNERAKAGHVSRLAWSGGAGPNLWPSRSRQRPATVPALCATDRRPDFDHAKRDTQRDTPPRIA